MFDPRTDVVFDPSGKNRLVYQAWFDSGGIVTNVFFLLLGSIFSFAVSQLMPAKALFKRYVLALTADSQHTLNDLWAAPDMDVGENYAKLLKAVSLAIIYAPLFPPLYLLAAAYLLVSFYASKFGIAHWFARPPHMSDGLNQSMRSWLAVTVALSLALKRCAMAHASAGIPLMVSAVAWAVYMLLYEVLAKTIRNEADLDNLDTDGTVFQDHQNMDVYVCPKLLRGKGTQPGVASGGGASPRTARTAEPKPKHQPTLEELARRHQPTFEEAVSATKLATRWRVTTTTSSATQAAAQAAAKVTRGWPTPTPAWLPKSVAAHAADLEISADLGRDDASIDMVAPSRPMGRATCGGSSGKLGLMEHLEAAKQSAKESAEKAVVETAAVETAAAAAQLSPSRAAAAPPAGPALEPPTPEQSRETRILLQALEALEQRADANAASVAAPPSRRDEI